MALKITFTSPSVGTTYGGSETLIHQFATHLSENNNVSVLTGHSPYLENRADVWSEKFSIVSVPFSPRFTPLNDAISKLYPRIDPYKYESISFYTNVRLHHKSRKLIQQSEVISTHYRLDSRLFSIYARSKGVASVFHILGTRYGREFFEKDKSTLYVATTNYEAEILRKEQGATIYDVVSPGVPKELLSARNPEFHERSGLLFVARIQKTKGLDELVGIMDRLKDETITIVGTGPDVAYLDNLATKHGLRSRIKIIGHKPPAEVYSLMRKSKLLVFPSHSETFGIVPLEANACGLPVVCTDIPQIREALGENAIFHSIENLDIWSDSVDSLVRDEKKWCNLSNRGREWAMYKTWDIKATHYEKCLKKAVETNQQ